VFIISILLRNTHSSLNSLKMFTVVRNFSRSINSSRSHVSSRVQPLQTTLGLPRFLSSKKSPSNGDATNEKSDPVIATTTTSSSSFIDTILDENIVDKRVSKSSVYVEPPFSSSPSQSTVIPPPSETDPATIAQTRLQLPSDRVTSLEHDPYGWPLSQRGVKEAPMWMLFEAQRNEEKLINLQGEKKTSVKEPVLPLIVPIRNKDGQSYSVGRRKTSVARVWISLGTGNIRINKHETLATYFPRLSDRRLAIEPLIVTESCGAFDIEILVEGGGLTGQAGAIRHGLANCLVQYDPQLRLLFAPTSMLQRDPRMVERKKPGQAGARRKFQWVKR
jgi:small subunit ribosomal protein S9